MTERSRSRVPRRRPTRGRTLMLLALVGPLLGAAPNASAQAGPAGAGDRGYTARYLVPPNPLPPTNGLALDGRGHLYVAQALYNRVTRIDLATGAAVRIADDTDPVSDALQSPDDLAIGPDGNLYVTNALKKSVVRMAPDGSARTTVAADVTDGITGPNGIAFAPDGRLFVSDLAFDPARPGGLWQVDPQGSVPRAPITNGLRVPEGFGFSSGGLAYVPEFYAGQIAVVNPADPLGTTRLPVRFQGLVPALKVMPKTLDPTEPLIVLEDLPDQSKVWKVDRFSGKRTLIATGAQAFDNLAIDPRSGTIYVSNLVKGGIQRVDPRTGKLVQVFAAGPLATPTSLSPRPDGSLLVAANTTLASVSRQGQVSTLSRFVLDGNQGATPGAVQIGNALYFTDWLDSSRSGRLMKLDLGNGAQTVVASGFALPWHVRQGPPGTVFLTDEFTGNVHRVNLTDGTQTVIAGGLASPAGLAYDAGTQRVYVSESGAGRVVAVPAGGGTPTPVATRLRKPEGITLDPQGRLLVVDAEGAAQQNPATPGSLLRVRPDNGRVDTLATGLPTKITGITLLPGFNYTSDVLARRDGTIVVSGAANGSLTELTPTG